MGYKNPQVTVLMPAYNGEKHIAEAIESILSQTLDDFELLIVNDGSTDNSRKIASSYGDHRIRIVDNDENMGIIATLNKGIEASQGAFLARMDADDVSYPTRLEKQVEFMRANPSVGICGSWVKTIGKPIARVLPKPASHAAIKAGLFFQNQIHHPSAIMRTAWIRRNGLYYDKSFIYLEDWELWQRASHYFPLANIPEVLVKYRLSGTTISSSRHEQQLKTIRRMCQRNQEDLGMQVNHKSIDIHYALSTRSYPSEHNSLTDIEKWLCEVYAANQHSGMYDEQVFSDMLLDRWISTCLSHPGTRRASWKFFNDSPLYRMLGTCLRQRIRLMFLLLVKWGQVRPWIKQTLGDFFSTA